MDSSRGGGLVVDRLIESEEVSLGFLHLKVACIAIGFESGKQVVWKQLAIGNFNLEDPTAASQSSQSMHAAIKAFLETNFASYLHLGELDLAGTCQLCLDPSEEERPLMGYSGNVVPSSTPPRN